MTRVARAERGPRADEAGLGILEVVLALTLFAVIMVGLAVSMGSGLRLTGRANGRQVASQAAVRTIELARTFGFDALGMSATTVYETGDPESPDANVTEGTPDTFAVPLPTGATEDIVDGGTITHKTTEQVGKKTISTYQYVTWANPGKTQKRVTVVSLFPGDDPVNGGRNQVVMSSIFSRRQIDFPTTVITSEIFAHSSGAFLTIDVASSSNFPASTPFMIEIDGEVFTVTSMSGLQWSVTAGGTAAHPLGAQVALSSTFNPPPTTTSTTAPSSSSTVPANCPGDSAPPTVNSFKVLHGSTDSSVGYTSSNTVTLVSDVVDACTPLQMELSNNAIFSGAWEPFTTAATWNTSAGEGFKVISVRFMDDNGNVTGIFQTSVIVDLTDPSPAPTGVTAVRQQGGKSARLTWNDVTNDTNKDGYRIFRQDGASGTFSQVGSVTSCSGGTCTYNEPNNELSGSTGYTYYVVGADKAGRISEESSQVAI